MFLFIILVCFVLLVCEHEWKSEMSLLELIRLLPYGSWGLNSGSAVNSVAAGATTH